MVIANLDSDPESYERVYTEYFQSGTVENVLWGEDMRFSKLLRDMKMEMYIFPNIHFGHFGINGWSGNYHQFLSEQKDKENQDAIEAMPIASQASQPGFA